MSNEALGHDIAVCDPETWSLLQQTMSDVLPQLVAFYCEDSPRLLAAMSTAHSDQTPDVVLRHAHTLKSSSQQLGFLRVAHIASLIETLAGRDEKNSAETITRSIAELEIELARVLALLSEHS
ncbi:MAG: Hpt domain-containing protein [Rickettsiales bacterium]|nr:Hpt domain-containing protein [Rickettsiales bacterium]